jgi:hypothetical protein
MSSTKSSVIAPVQVNRDAPLMDSRLSIRSGVKSSFISESPLDAESPAP